MKTKWLILAFPVLLTSCFTGDDSTNVDNENNAQGTGSPYLAREVTGVWLLSEDHRFGYDEPCNALDEGYIQHAFNVNETDKLETLDRQEGCEFRWAGGSINVGFGGPRPFQSMYHAEYQFNKLYQGNDDQVSGQAGSEPNQKPSYHGPEPEGTGAERPAIEPKGGASADIDDDASTAANDSSDSPTNIPPVAAQFTKPPISIGRFVAVPNVGDKAVWEPAKNTLHVLYNNHIVNVGVQTKDSPAQRQQKAIQLAELILDRFSEDVADWN
ncbi:hypothetical protein ACFSUS_06615 [Spirosoma soli]|uniref:Uncharacterized protein n=1 Tax=Spirosoma soli TaxID=1770529 RepID=A0ABW5M180_9BACT